MDVSQYKLCSI